MKGGDDEALPCTPGMEELLRMGNRLNGRPRSDQIQIGDPEFRVIFGTANQRAPEIEIPLNDHFSDHIHLWPVLTDSDRDIIT